VWLAKVGLLSNEAVFLNFPGTVDLLPKIISYILIKQNKDKLKRR